MENSQTTEETDTITPVTELQKASDGISVMEAAKRLGVTGPTVRSWIKRGILPATQFGDTIVRIHPDDLEKLRRPA